MCTSSSSLSGPDRLDAIAEQELANGNTVHADTYHQLAREWRQLQADHDSLDRRNHDLQQRLDQARNALVTPQPI